MSVIGDIFGAGGVATLLGKAVDKIWPDPNERAKAQVAILEAEQRGEFKVIDAQVELARQQTDINKIEAASTNWFIAGWRPGLGWTGALSYFYTFIINPFLVFGATVWGTDAVREAITHLPHLDMGPLATLTMGMLGLAGARSFEKWADVEKKR